MSGSKSENSKLASENSSFHFIIQTSLQQEMNSMFASKMLRSAVLVLVPKARMASTWRMGRNVVRPEDQHSVSALYMAIVASGIYFASVATPRHGPEYMSVPFKSALVE